MKLSVTRERDVIGGEEVLAERGEALTPDLYIEDADVRPKLEKIPGANERQFRSEFKAEALRRLAVGKLESLNVDKLGVESAYSPG
ncbi:hypothetical protein K0M31_020362 [Melipona bicolor]|uniref:Uncharacterized protein n=1 Tax=Melipona bicolor TaxID=60889 RepID=A0AA40G1H2_9HYME|nr:hypothetical protein K0M31_020362 [Melipona bicolor]